MVERVGEAAAAAGHYAAVHCEQLVGAGLTVAAAVDVAILDDLLSAWVNNLYSEPSRCRGERV